MNIEKDLELDLGELEPMGGHPPVVPKTGSSSPLACDAESVLSDPLLQSVLSGESGADDHEAGETGLQKYFDLLGKISGALSATQENLLEEMTHFFGELTYVLTDPERYARTLTQILADEHAERVPPVLDNQTAMAVAVAYSRSPLHSLLTGTNQAEKEAVRTQLNPQLAKIINLSEAKDAVLGKVSQKIESLAPNICQIVGSFMTAVLIGRAGGLTQLARIPACNLLALAGRTERNHSMVGFTKAHRLGEFGSLKLVLQADEESRPRLAKLLSNAVSKVSRIDAAGLQKEGLVGREMLKDLTQKFEKSKLPKAGQRRKPLPIPDDVPKKRRGGRKFRRAKEKLALTEARAAKNRIKFGAAFDETIGGINPDELGMLAQMGSGKLKIQKKAQKMSLSKKQHQRLDKDRAKSGGKGGIDFSGRDRK
jgi:U4/U6 small nuclear ribonucleoprotein PRP31